MCQVNVLQLNQQKLPDYVHLIHLYCPIITAGTDKLGPSAGRVAGVNEGGVALQTLDSLAGFAVPNTHSLVCAG